MGPWSCFGLGSSILGRTDSCWAMFRNMSVVSSPSAPLARPEPEDAARPSRARSVSSLDPMSPFSSPLPSEALWHGRDAGSMARLRREPEERNALMGGTRTGPAAVGEAEAGVAGDWGAERDGGALYEIGGGR